MDWFLGLLLCSASGLYAQTIITLCSYGARESYECLNGTSLPQRGKGSVAKTRNMILLALWGQRTLGKAIVNAYGQSHHLKKTFLVEYEELLKEFEID